MRTLNHIQICLGLTLGSFLILFACGQLSAQQNTEVKIDQSQGPNPWTNLNWNNDKENFQFVVVTDRTGGNRPGVFEQGVEKVNLLQPEFVMSVGDLINGYTEDLEQLNQEWEEFDQFVDSLDMPFFYVAGNHDITNKVMEDLWSERYGRTYYHFVYQNVLFLCLNSEEPVPLAGDPHGSYDPSDFYMSDEQRAYISQTLNDHKDVRWTFVFWHKPVWLYEESDNPRYQEFLPKSGWNEVEAMLKERKHTVFAGHVHRYFHRERNNSDYVTLATTGGGSSLRGPIFGQFDHVLWVTMTDEGPIMANLLLQGILDKRMAKEDIEKYLALNVKSNTFRVDNQWDNENPLESQTVKFTVFNNQDVPVAYQMDLTNSEHITYGSSNISGTVPPNAATTFEVEMVVTTIPATTTNEADEEAGLIRWKELRQHRAHWNLTYELEQYGKIEISGSKRLY